MREAGNYFVKLHKGSQWLMAEYSGDKCGNPGWWIMKFDKYFKDYDLFEINETRILNPDEK